MLTLGRFCISETCVPRCHLLQNVEQSFVFLISSLLLPLPSSSSSLGFPSNSTSVHLLVEPNFQFLPIPSNQCIIFIKCFFCFWMGTSSISALPNRLIPNSNNNNFTTMSNASSFAGQFDVDGKSPASFDFESEYLSFKRPANPPTLPNSRAQVVNEARIRYFKTRLCRKFRLGICILGSDCSFAHSVGELRRQEFGNDDRTIQESKLCRMFYQGQQCSYGNTCRFLHTGPGGLNHRDTATVEVIPTGHGKRKHDQLELKSGLDESSGAEVNPKRELLKTKKCIKWDMNGHCPY